MAHYYRFFILKDQIIGNEIIFLGVNYTHIKKVLRLKSGECVCAFDGLGNEFTVKLEQFFKDKIVSVIVSKRFFEKPKSELTLGLSILKSHKVDLVIQKAVELGVTKIVPIQTENVKFRNDKSFFKKKQVRWESIIINAASQSKCVFLPKLYNVSMLTDFLEVTKSSELRLLLCVDSKISLREYLNKYFNNKLPNTVSVIVGPEAGFAKKEVLHCENRGYKGVNLGNQILRAETATVSLLSILQFKLENLG